MASGKVSRGYLGIYMQPVTPDLAGPFGLDTPQGILVAEVIDGSPAEEAGLKPGDIILELDGTDVSSTSAFRNTIASKKPGAKLALTVHRDGKTFTVKTTTADIPMEGDATTDADLSTDEPAETLGFAVRDLTADEAHELDIEPGAGVLIHAVAPDSPAADKGLQPGDLVMSVNRIPVADVRAFNKMVAESQKSGAVLFYVKSRRGSRYVVLKFL